MATDGKMTVINTARSAVRRYFEPFSWLAALARRQESNSGTGAASREGRRFTDRFAYNFAVATGLAAVVMAVGFTVSIARLSSTERILQSKAINYLVDIVSLRSSSEEGVQLAGNVSSSDHSLASMFGGREVDLPTALWKSNLELIAVVRPTEPGSRWLTQKPITVNGDGTFATRLECKPVDECQVTVLLVPAGSVRPGTQTKAVPAATSASQIVAVRPR